MNHPSSVPTSRRPFRLWCIAVSVVLASASLVGCSAAGDATAGHQSSEVRIATPTEPPNWDYVNNPSSVIKQVLMFNVIEPLIEKDPENKFAPLLAKSYDVSSDGRVYTFEIRSATFHDGSQLTADDVVYSLETNRHSSQAALSAPFGAVTSIEKAGDMTVKVTLKRPSQAFLAGMSGPSGLIMPSDSAKRLAAHPIGTGPYTFGKQRTGVDVTLNRYPKYWGTSPKFKTAVFRFIGDETSSVNALLAHDVDVVTPLEGAGLERVKTVAKSPGFAVVKSPPTQVNYISLNAADKVFADSRVRQAIAYAVNRKDVVDGALAGLQPEACMLDLPISGTWRSSECPYTFDPQKAKQLLAAAGVKDLTLRFVYLNLGSYPAAEQILAKQLADVGIKVDAKGVDHSTYIDQVVVKKDYQITQITTPQPSDSWRCPSAMISGDCYEPYDKALAAADEAEKITDWSAERHRAVLMLSQRAYTIPLAKVRKIGLHRSDLVGFKTDAYNGELDLRGLHWKK